MPNVFVKLPGGQGATVLKALNSQSRKYGYQLSKELNISIQTIYTILSRLEKSGFVKGEREDNSKQRALPRRFYSITCLGMEAVAQMEILENKGFRS